MNQLRDSWKERFFLRYFKVKSELVGLAVGVWGPSLKESPFEDFDFLDDLRLHSDT